ncbi:hypothetical protein [Altericista sp. CCNU0014]|uniref:hypothetical protein n=1 Tax=Altericista sp. CCNU0014 TaxID=3082949 RepID=UPI00384EA563
MNPTNNLICPKCDNKYPLNSQLIQCPACDVDLIVPNQYSNINSRKAGKIKGNTAPVILGDGNIINEQEKSKIADYSFSPKGEVSQFQLGFPVASWLTFSAVSMWLLHTSGSIASVLQFYQYLVFR